MSAFSTPPELPLHANGMQLGLAELLHCRQQAQLLNIRPHGKSKAMQHGQYVASMKGRGMEFAEVRRYLPGDDVRTIDWRVTARSGQVHTKLFQEERERPVYLLVDLSPGMHFGSTLLYKSVQACHLAASFAWAAAMAGDRVGLITANRKGVVQLAPKPRRKSVMRLLETLVESHARPPASAEIWQQQWPTLDRHLTPGSLIVVISDFANLSERQCQLLQRWRQHHELILNTITDPLEQDVPQAFRGQLQVTDGSSEGLLDFSSSQRRKNYQHQLQNHWQQTQNTLNRYSLNQLRISAGSPLTQQLAPVGQGGSL